MARRVTSDAKVDACSLVDLTLETTTVCADDLSENDETRDSGIFSVSDILSADCCSSVRLGKLGCKRRRIRFGDAHRGLFSVVGGQSFDLESRRMRLGDAHLLDPSSFGDVSCGASPS